MRSLAHIEKIKRIKTVTNTNNIKLIKFYKGRPILVNILNKRILSKYIKNNKQIISFRVINPKFY